MKPWQTVFYHFLFWSAYLFLYATIWQSGELSFQQALMKELALLPFKLILTYGAIFFLAPRYLYSGRYLRFTILLIALITCCAILHQVYVHFLLSTTISGIKHDEKFFDLGRLTKRATFLNTPMLIGLTFVSLRNWYKQRETNIQIRNEKLEMELQSLRAQIQPHFLFNVLNGLHSMALDKSDDTPHMILSLANIMRYLTDQKDKQWVSLDSELGFLKDYVALEEMRHIDRLTVQWHIQIDESEWRIPPITLNTLVENAFKHGVSPDHEKSFIIISLVTTKNDLVYEVKNSKPLATDARLDNRNGTGLKNLRNRLAIVYGNKFSLTITDNEIFRAELKLSKRIV